ncbi:MAG: hypothetical protein N3I86_05250 [Verrucomicrobiae bacterium]|nr:hypothetical protein [Verrucomicrobiae bacterium]MDW8309405.1 hypothetical protein [Verrucomicrobiales bacterium]
MNSNVISHHLFVAALSNEARPVGENGPDTAAPGNGPEAVTRVSRRLARALAAAESGRAARMRAAALSLGRALDSRSSL